MMACDIVEAKPARLHAPAQLIKDLHQKMTDPPKFTVAMTAGLIDAYDHDNLTPGLIFTDGKTSTKIYIGLDGQVYGCTNAAGVDAAFTKAIDAIYEAYHG